VATTQEEGADAIISICERHGVGSYQGSTDDVLARFYHCATKHRFDPIIRVTSDCPLIDISLITEALQQFKDADDPSLYLVSDVEVSFPRGFDFEIFSYSALEDAYNNAQTRHQREHVTPWLYEGESSKEYKIKMVEHREALATKMRLTVDTPNDFELIKILVEEHGLANASFLEIVDFLKANPVLCTLNLG
jgi:spore coat polysaccharide biosynthesis protein SpsF